tara:strand:+ start:267 stop:506 length:240 start_codon:yes stop_codon:yes gene_type:complete
LIKLKLKIFRCIAYATLLCIFFTKPAYAYIDPGTVSIVVQAVVAGVAGAAATFRYWISWVKNLFTFSKPKPKTEDKKDD